MPRLFDYPQPPAWMSEIRDGTLHDCRRLEEWCRQHGRPQPTLLDLAAERRRRGTGRR